MFMNESTIKPLSDAALDALTETATKAMRRAYCVAKKEAARYGLTLIVNRPRPLPAKAHAKRLRRVEKRIQRPVVH